MIRSLNEALDVLDNHLEGIPFKAIRCVYNQKPSQKITQKIVFALSHAYDSYYYDEVSDATYETPLWYAIIAENHLSEELIDPVVELFTTTDDDWDFLDEQGQYLIGKLAEKYPDKMMKKLMEVIDALLTLRSSMPYLYLFDAFYYIDIQKYKKWLLKVLSDPRLQWKESLAVTIADLQIKEAIPVLEKMLKEEDIWKADIRESIKQLKTGIDPYNSKPYCQERGSWEDHYRDFESRFSPEDPVLANPKVGRNDPCFCGSGKKYKKCCLLKIN